MKTTFHDRLVLPKRDNFDGWYSRGYFPHFDAEEVTQHVCFHLFDSLPQRILSRLREEIEASYARDMVGTATKKNREWRARIHETLDSGYGSCLLRDERLAKIVEKFFVTFRR